MKVIFKRDLAKIGRKHDVKDVSNGYALNFLIPNGYAVIATPEAEKNLETIKATEAAHKKVQLDLLRKNLKAIEALTLIITSKANEKGHLFSSIHKEDLKKELLAQGNLDVPSDVIHLDKPIKEVGMHQVKIGEGKEVVALNVEVKA